MSNQSANQSANQSVNQSANQTETDQEILNRLEKTYVEKVSAVNELRFQVLNLQEQLVEAHKLAFKALQKYSTAKEQYLISIINSQKNQIEKLSIANNTVDSAVDNVVDNVVVNAVDSAVTNEAVPAPTLVPAPAPVVQPSAESRTDNLA